MGRLRGCRYGQSVGWTSKRCTMGSGIAPAFPTHRARHRYYRWPTDCVHHVPALRDQNIDLPQLRDDLFRQSSSLDTAELEEIKQEISRLKAQPPALSRRREQNCAQVHSSQRASFAAKTTAAGTSSAANRAGFSSNVAGVNSRRSSSPSPIRSGTGHVMPVTHRLYL